MPEADAETALPGVDRQQRILDSKFTEYKRSCGARLEAAHLTGTDATFEGNQLAQHWIVFCKYRAGEQPDALLRDYQSGISKRRLVNHCHAVMAAD